MQVYFNVLTCPNQLNTIKRQNRNQQGFLNNNISGVGIPDLFFCSNLKSAAKKIKNTPQNKLVLERANFLDKLFPHENLKGMDDEGVLIKKLNKKTLTGKSIVKILTDVLEDEVFDTNYRSKMQKKVIECMFLQPKMMHNIDIVKKLDILNYDELNKLKGEGYKKIRKILSGKSRKVNHKKSQESWKEIRISKDPDKYKNTINTVVSRLKCLEYLLPGVDFIGVKSLKEYKKIIEESPIANFLREVISKNEKEFDGQETEVLRMWLGLGDEGPLSTQEIQKRLRIKDRDFIVQTRDDGIMNLKKIILASKDNLSKNIPEKVVYSLKIQKDSQAIANWKEIRISKDPDKYKNTINTVVSRLKCLEYLLPGVDFIGAKSLKEYKKMIEEKPIANYLREIISKNEKEFDGQETEVLRMWLGLGDEGPLSIREIQKRLHIEDRDFIVQTRDDGIMSLKKIILRNEENILNAKFIEKNSSGESIVKISINIPENEVHGPNKYKNTIKTVVSRLKCLEYLLPGIGFNGVKSLKEYKKMIEEKPIANFLREVISKNEKAFTDKEKEVFKMWIGLGDEGPLSIWEIQKRLHIKDREIISDARNNSIKKIKKILFGENI